MFSLDIIFFFKVAPFLIIILFWLNLSLSHREVKTELGDVHQRKRGRISTFDILSSNCHCGQSEAISQFYYSELTTHYSSLISEIVALPAVNHNYKVSLPFFYMLKKKGRRVGYFGEYSPFAFIKLGAEVK